jgi:hypothetical protein
MCYAAFVASGSFFLGQPKVLSVALRVEPVLAMLAFLPLLLMLFHLWRHRDRRRHVVAAPAPGIRLPDGELSAVDVH